MNTVTRISASLTSSQIMCAIWVWASPSGGWSAVHWITRYLVFLLLLLVVGRMIRVLGKKPLPLLPGNEGTAKWVIVAITVLALSEALLFVPGIGLFVGGVYSNPQAVPDQALLDVLGVTMALAIVAPLTALVFTTFAKVFRLPRAGGFWDVVWFWASISIANAILTWLRTGFGMPDPSTTGYTAFASNVLARFGTPSPNFGWIAFLALPCYKVIVFLNSGLNDIGLSAIGLGLCVFAASLPFNYQKKQRYRLYAERISVLRSLSSDLGTLMRYAQAEANRLRLRSSGQLIGLLARILLLPTLYYLFKYSAEFHDIHSVVSIPDLSTRAHGVMLPLIVLLVVALWVTLSSWRTLPVAGSAVAAGIVAGIAMGSVSFFVPAGIVLVLTGNAAAEAIQAGYELARVKLTFDNMLVPVAVMLPLFLLLSLRNNSTPPPAVALEQSPAAPPRGQKVPTLQTQEAPGAQQAAQPSSAAVGQFAMVSQLCQSKNFDGALTTVNQIVQGSANDKTVEKNSAGVLAKCADIAQSSGDRVAAYNLLCQANKLLPQDGVISGHVADLVLDVANEELGAVNVRSVASDFGAAVAHPQVGDALQIRCRAPEKDTDCGQQADGEQQWYPVALGSVKGWVRSAVLEDVSQENSAVVASLRDKNEVFEMLDRVAQLDHGKQFTVFYLKQRANWRQLVGIGILVIVGMLLLIKIRGRNLRAEAI